MKFERFTSECLFCGDVRERGGVDRQKRRYFLLRESSCNFA